MDVGLTFDDVLLVPQYSTVDSRKNCSVNVKFFGSTLRTPLIPANMDTITEQKMLATVFKRKGIGFIHRYMPVVKQVSMIRGALDSCYDGDPESLPSWVGLTIGVNESYNDLKPFLEEHIWTSSDGNGYNVPVSVVLIDVAHAHSKRVIERIKRLKEDYPALKVLAGNVATRHAALELMEAGVDGLKVGIGSGTICSTRLETGFGIPQITAIQEVVSARNSCGFEYDEFPIISDGGIKHYGDIAKAIAAGANFVMSGYLFAGCPETPGDVVQDIIGGAYKVYRGMASKEAREDWEPSLLKDRLPEGVSRTVPTRESAKVIFAEAEQALRSSMSYCGVKSLENLYEESEFLVQTAAGLRESGTI